MKFLRNPILPYNNSSGWSGTDTSKNRADTQDVTGLTGKTQNDTLYELSLAGEDGLTWKELSQILDLHHGAVSGALSVLHKAGKISRLLETRSRCRVYVTNEYVLGRETDSQGRKPKECPNCGHVL